jgi:ethanolamine utilization protein EutQ (cupin superfamily)
MAAVTTPPAKKSLSKPDETRTFPKGRMDIVTVGDLTFGRGTLEPGWKWSECVKPIVKTDLCMVHHSGYIVSGRIHVRMADGTEIEAGAGDVFVVPPGHDAWIVGDETWVAYEFSGAKDYAKPA